MVDHPTDALKARPWADLSYFELGEARKVPTMLSKQEQMLYYWLAANVGAGSGDIVDLGAFAGGSTACLAAGHVSVGGEGRIHAYDRFTADDKTKARVLYPQGIKRFEGNDILPLARELLSPWQGRVEFHKGEITDTEWDGTPIAVLTLDASKIASKMDRMAATFFPSLVPGRSVIVQQDFLHYSQPWVAAQMELFADYFEFLAFCPNDSMVYRCTRQIDEDALEAGEAALLTDAELSDLVTESARRHAGLGLEDRFEMMQRAIEINRDQRVAWKMRKPEL